MRATGTIGRPRESCIVEPNSILIKTGRRLCKQVRRVRGEHVQKFSVEKKVVDTVKRDFALNTQADLPRDSIQLLSQQIKDRYAREDPGRWENIRTLLELQRSRPYE
jgi:hypothetical protein